MDTTSKRDEWERHNRDEAKARAAQQADAGPTHRPVPFATYAVVGTQAAAPDAELDAGTLVDEYERAIVAERHAWLAARDLVGDGSGKEAWDEWRDAVERTQRAARRIVNHRTARSQAT